MRKPSLEILCKNCDFRFKGNFCNNCGQKFNTQRIDSKYIAGEFSKSVIQINHGFFFTIKELFLRPEVCLKNYIEGKRKRYFKPLTFLLFTSAFYAFISHLFNFNTYSEDLVQGFIGGFSDPEAEKVSNTLTFVKWLAKNHAYAVLLTLPIFSFCSYIAFIKSKFNYFEHLILNTYITGQQMIIYLTSTLMVSQGHITEAIPLTLSVIYNSWVFFKLFNTNKAFTRIFLSLLTYFIFIFIIQIVLFMIIGFYLIEKLYFQ